HVFCVLLPGAALGHCGWPSGRAGRLSPVVELGVRARRRNPAAEPGSQARRPSTAAEPGHRERRPSTAVLSVPRARPGLTAAPPRMLKLLRLLTGNNQEEVRR